MKKFFLFLLLVPAMLVQAQTHISISQFIQNADPNTTYRLRGVVSNITNTTFGNFNLTDETGTILVYGLKTATGATKQFSTLGVDEGDTLTLDGNYKLYNGKHEVDPAQYVSHVKPTVVWVPVSVSIQDFIDLNDGKRYILTGVVTSIVSEQYGNLNIEDETGSIYVYGLSGFSNHDIAVGDTLTISGVYLYYNNTTPEVTAGRYLNHVHPTVEVPAELLRVCAQNIENYYYNYDQSSRPKYNDAAGFQAKTSKIVNSMLTIDADIYAFCEVEAKPIVLAQLADSMNAHAGVADRYAAVSDNIDYEFNDGYDNHLKSGFIYRTDRVETVGANTNASGVQYYRNTMRIQAFKLLANNEALVLSMNHFKAKDSSEGQGESTRMMNASHLVNALGNVSTDPDILVLGDLNCEYGEAPITTIINVGFEEQLLRFDSAAYSHCYDGGELIDHVLANASMSAQITNAYVSHVCTDECTEGVYWYNSYSDHDPYVIDIILGKKITTDVETTETMPLKQQAKKIIRQGQIIIIRGGVEYSITGQRL